MKLKIKKASYHRNGVCGMGFYAIIFEDKEETGLISRFRRMLQHEYPSLRGKSYGKRKKMVKQVQKDLGYNVKGGK